MYWYVDALRPDVIVYHGTDVKHYRIQNKYEVELEVHSPTIPAFNIILQPDSWIDVSGTEIRLKRQGDIDSFGSAEHLSGS